MEELKLPAFNYYLDNSDLDIVILRRQDGSFVAAFSASGATKEGIVQLLRRIIGSLEPPPIGSVWACKRARDARSSGECPKLREF
jgi:hypothetical protein